MRTANYLLPTALCLLLAGTATAQIEIIAPPEALEVGRHYLLEVRGLTAEDLPRASIIAEPKATTSAIGVSGWAGQQFIWFSASDTGRRFVAIALNQPGDGPPVVAGVVLEIGGEPDPDPEPDPTPPPVPPVPGELEVVCLFESEDRTPSQATTLLGLRQYCGDEQIRCELVDKDKIAGQTGKTPAWMLPYLKAAEGKQLPLLLIGSVTDSATAVVAAEPLAESAREAIELVEEYHGT